MSTYPSLDAYNADVIAAREAHFADMAVQENLCAECKTRKRDGQGRNGHRLCRTCRRNGVQSK